MDETKTSTSLEVITPTDNAVALRQAEALAVLSSAVSDIAAFLTKGGLVEVLSGYARSQAVKDILGGLAAHDGRQALNAQTMDQNALEIVHQVEKVFAKYQEKLTIPKGDPDLHNAEENFRQWLNNNKKENV